MEVFQDNSLANRLPTKVGELTTSHVLRLKYVTFAAGREQGLLVTGQSGASGHGFELALFVRTRSGAYRDLFKDVVLEYNPTILEDIDADGMLDLVTIFECKLKMYSLKAGLLGFGYEEMSAPHEAVVELLEQTIRGRELLTHYDRWAEFGCTKMIEDGGDTFQQIDDLTSEERDKSKRLQKTIDLSDDNEDTSLMNKSPRTTSADEHSRRKNNWTKELRGGD